MIYILAQTAKWILAAIGLVCLLALLCWVMPQGANFLGVPAFLALVWIGGMAIVRQRKTLSIAMRH